MVERLWDAFAAGDAEAVMARMSEDPHTVFIGTDPNEWWEGDARLVVARQIEESGPVPISLEKIDAWEEGSCGWASAMLRIEWADVWYDARWTAVFHLERGEWKAVQAHISLPQPQESVGMSLTTTLEELEKAMQREQPDISASFGVDGTVTIVFTDIVDSTVMLSRLGDTAWVEVIRRHNELLKQVTAAHGGTVVEVQGDGSMLSFASVRRAVACAQEIQQVLDRAFVDLSPPIRVRIGIHTGDAIKEAEHFFGTTVHYAARVASQALGGEVLVSAVVRDLLAGGRSNFSFLESRDVELKGLEGQHRLYALAST